MTNGFLDKAFQTRDAASTRSFYDAWSPSYESDVSQNRYATPERCAKALATYCSDKDAPILDFGCGTGLSGLALRNAGFRTIDGMDISADMLEKARAKRLYRHVHQSVENAALPHKTETYTSVSAVSVIDAGAAPVSVLHMLMQGLNAGGKLVFSYNDHSLENPQNEAALNEWLDCGAARLLFKEYGPHLPGINLNANVYVIEKT
ncbi:MAG: methyltransferase domain-containing protein [Roseobacter sp.]